MPWLFLSDPEDYSFTTLFERKRDVWDGVNGSVAQKYLRELQKGDRIIGYHTAPEKQVVCELEAVSAPYQNPKQPDKKNVVVDVKPVHWFSKAVPLAELRSNAKLNRMKMLTMMRPIAVSPLTDHEYAELLRLGS
jgi:predicted RNA-binding protein with PUA-like domain